MNFNKNPFIKTNNVSKPNNINYTNNFNRTNVNNIKESMLKTNFNAKEMSREIVKQKDLEHQNKHEQLANTYSQYNSSQNITRNNNIEAQNKLLKGKKFGN